jgi:hypothetical protein
MTQVRCSGLVPLLLLVPVVVGACAAAPPPALEQATPPVATASFAPTRAAVAPSAAPAVALPSVPPSCSDPAVLADPPGLPVVDRRGIGYTEALIAAARAWLPSTRVGPSLAGHLLVPAGVSESGGRAALTFHDYDTGTQIRVILATNGAQPRLLRVEDPSSAPSGLSAYERVCFEAAVRADRATLSWLGADASTAARLEFSGFALASCPSEPGFCASAVVMDRTASYPYPPRVSVDLRTARVIHDGG